MRCDFQHLVMFFSLRCYMLTTRRWVHVQLDDFTSASATLAVALAALALATGVILALGSSHGQYQVVNWAQLRSTAIDTCNMLWCVHAYAVCQANAKGIQLLWQGPNISKHLKTCNSNQIAFRSRKTAKTLRVSANLAAVFVQSLHY